MAGPLTNQQRSSEYYRIAYKCAEVKSTKGCDNNCAACVLNVHLYVDDPRDATLIKTSAALNYVRDVAEVEQWNARVRRENIWDAVACFFSIAIPIALLWVIFVLPISCVVKSCKQALAPREAVPEASYSSDIGISAAQYCKQNIRDVNGDGLKNCIDYAVLYKEYLPSARLIWNYNKNTGWSHIFVQVNGIKLEPTYVYGSVDNRRIEYVWGSKYDSRYDKDVTAYYSSIRAGTMQWYWDWY
jgi:hypothetical protein